MNHSHPEAVPAVDISVDIAVVGAGIAGLVAGVVATESGASVALIDAVSPGGRAKTVERDGYRYNVGAHALYLEGHLLPFLAARGLEPRGGVPDTKTLRLLRGGRLHDFTATPIGIARASLLSRRSRLRIMALMAKVPRLDTRPFVGRTWQEWLGNEPDDVAGIVQMLVRTGTYVNAPAQFDAAAALDQLKLALRGVRYVDGGWQTIVDSLVARFWEGGGRLVTASVTHVDGDDDAVVDTSGGRVNARAVVLAGLGPDAVERLTGRRVAGRGDAGGEVHASALDLALRTAHASLVFGIDEPLYLSPHGPTARLAPDGAGLVSLLLYPLAGEGDAWSPDAVRSRLRDLATSAGIAAHEVVHERYLHRVVVANSFPSAAGGGVSARPRTDALGVPAVSIAGDWVGPQHQLGDAASASGEAAARRALAHVQGRARVAV